MRYRNLFAAVVLFSAAAIPALADVTFQQFTQSSTINFISPNPAGGPPFSAQNVDSHQWTFPTFNATNSTSISAGGDNTVEGYHNPPRSASATSTFSNITANGFTLTSHMTAAAQEVLWPIGFTNASAVNETELRFRYTQVGIIQLTVVCTIGPEGGSIDLGNNGLWHIQARQSDDPLFGIPTGTIVSGAGVHTLTYSATMNPTWANTFDVFDMRFNQGGNGLPYGAARSATVDWTLTISVPAPASASLLLGAALCTGRRSRRIV